jgi:uncharacterized protein YjiS (DUF1127 family)
MRIVKLPGNKQQEAILMFSSAQAHGQPQSSLRRPSQRPGASAVARFRSWMDRRRRQARIARNTDALSDLSDHVLKDIGVARHQLSDPQWIEEELIHRDLRRGHHIETAGEK